MGLTAEGSEFDSWQGQDFLPLHVVQTGSGAHSCPLGTEGFSLGVKWQDREAAH
jgi:hypothetical protein